MLIDELASFINAVTDSGMPIPVALNALDDAGLISSNVIKPLDIASEDLPRCLEFLKNYSLVKKPVDGDLLLP
jgi:hypothetical protein